MKIFLPAVFSAGMLMAAPEVSKVSAVAGAGGIVTVTYTLSGAPAIVTFDVLEGETSIGERNLWYSDGDVCRKVVTDGEHTFTWDARKSWPNANASVKVGHRWKASTWTNDQFHAVSVKPGSLLAKTWGAGRQKVNTSHMYGIRELAPDFDVTAVADDGVIEAIEHRTKPIVGVQFHPERLAVRDGNKRALALIKAALEGRRPSELED